MFSVTIRLTIKSKLTVAINMTCSERKKSEPEKSLLMQDEYDYRKINWGNGWNQQLNLFSDTNNLNRVWFGNTILKDWSKKSFYLNCIIPCSLLLFA